MSTQTEPYTVDHCQHVVQFYERDEELVDGAGGHLSNAVSGGGIAIVIATETHREAFEAKFADAGVDVAVALAEGTLVWLDATATLATFMRHGRVDRDAFLARLGPILAIAAATGRPVRAFGEMVALLWEAGDVIAAIDLETLWNELATQVPFSLYCAYRTDSVTGHEHAHALEQVCGLHSAVVTAPPVERSWQFPADTAAPGNARDALAGALQHRGHDPEFLHDVRLVVTELAANAVVHASSPFSVAIRERDSTLRIVVSDRSSVAPALSDASASALSGRGMRLVAAIATRWGVDLTPDGKAVWAELSASR